MPIIIIIISIIISIIMIIICSNKLPLECIYDIKTWWGSRFVSER